MQASTVVSLYDFGGKRMEVSFTVSANSETHEAFDQIDLPSLQLGAISLSSSLSYSGFVIFPHTPCQ